MPISSSGFPRLALSNPIPEIMPELAHATRDDAIACTGRSDYPNQVNNLLCFPFLFRGALDCRAVTVTDGMKLAAARAIADLAADALRRDYLIPSPFDTRLLSAVAPSVAAAATADGVALKPLDDGSAYASSW
jgi:malate dehydrogenase (oxaloacetate-decarboxylating)(NADP+)